MTTSRVFVWVLSTLFLLASAPLWTDHGEAMAQSEPAGASEGSSDGTSPDGDNASKDTGEQTAGDQATGEAAGEPRNETRSERRKRLREERRAARRAKRAARRAEKKRKAEEKKRKAEERRRARAEARARARGETVPEGTGDGAEAASTDGTADGSDGTTGEGQEAADGATGDSTEGTPAEGDMGDGSDMKAGEQDDRPWAKGVSMDDQEVALKLFRDGNKLLKDALFVRAEVKYREALGRWDHPGIHFNRSLALLNLDQPIELHNSLEKAMQHGPEGLDKGKFDRAQTMMQTVKGQLAHLKVVCLEPDAEVTLNGKKLFTAPGEWEGLVTIGEHNAVATKAGYINANQVNRLKARERGTIELQLFTAEDVTEYRRRWAIWKPWTVFGLGTAVTLGGGLMHLFSFQNFQDFDAAVDACGGCAKEDLTPAEAELDDKASTQQNIAFSMYAVGGVTLLTGLVLVYANRTKPYRLDVEKRDRDNLIVTPVISPEMTGVNALIRF